MAVLALSYSKDTGNHAAALIHRKWLVNLELFLKGFPKDVLCS